MKRHFAGFLALILAGAACFSIVACGETDTNDETDGGEKEPVVTVTEAEWKSILSACDNFTDQTPYVVLKMDGADKLENDTSDGVSIFSKENGKYYLYAQEAGSTEWNKMSIDELTVQNQVLPAGDVVAILQNDFASFTFAEGKYTCASFTTTFVGSTVTIKDASVTFSDGAPTSVTYTMDFGGEAGSTLHTISNFGTTKISLPTQFNDMTDITA